MRKKYHEGRGTMGFGTRWLAYHFGTIKIEKRLAYYLMQ